MVVIGQEDNRETPHKIKDQGFTTMRGMANDSLFLK
jgi:hypothetical protein